MNFRISILTAACTLALSYAQAQVNVAGQDTSRRVITTAVPFLTIAPDARAAAMGDVGVATSADANSMYWNIAKLAFIENDMGFSLSYSRWLAKIIDDMSIANLSGYFKINKEQTVGLAMSYFDLGQIQFTDWDGNDLQDFRPREFALAGSYSRLLSDEMSVGVTLKYIHSNLTGNVYTSTNDSQAGVSLAADVGWYWNKDIMAFGKNSNIALGATITNIGAKLTYSNDEQNEFIPTNLRLGSAWKLEVDPFNSFTFALDFNKLMVPTPPVYEYDETGQITGIARGKDPDRALLSGMFGSFTDAPDGFSEELQEVMIATGIEYWYKDIFAARGGYFHEHTNKGNRKYFTLGLGMRYNVFGIDFAYLVPTQNEHPLAETLRFSLLFNFDNSKGEDSITDDKQ
jgi:hypothetical protein